MARFFHALKLATILTSLVVCGTAVFIGIPALLIWSMQFGIIWTGVLVLVIVFSLFFAAGYFNP